MATILILDHEAIYRNLCREILLRDNHTVLTFSSGEKISSILAREEADLAVMDPCLPGEDGFSLIKKISEDIPVVVFTGIITIEMEKRAFEAGAGEVLSKTGNLEDLKGVIKKILSREIRSSEMRQASHEKVLVVDDDDSICCLLKIFLEKKGFCPLTAHSGEEALEIVRKEHPRMILLDFIMPGMNGIATLKRIREMDPQAGVVIATGIQDKKMIREAAELGAYASVFKPFDLKYLELVVLTRLMMAC